MTDVADADSEESESDAEGADAGSAEVDADPGDAESEPGTGRAEADEPGDASEGTDVDPGGGVPGADDARRGNDAPDELIARVAAVDEAAAVEVEALRRRVDEVEAELEEAAETRSEREETIEELESKLTRARADFRNYKKRATQREEELRERATEDLVERLLDVRDNLVRALEQDDDVEVREGVEATLATFDRVLDAENVSAIEPGAGGDVDPERHEVVHRTESDQPEGTIDRVYRPGYEMAGRVLRPAQVTVSEGATEEADGHTPSESEPDDRGTAESDDPSAEPADDQDSSE